MITLTIVERTEKKGQVSIKRGIKVFTSKDKAEKIIKPIVSEMKAARREKRDANIYIESVSYDENSERQILLDLHAIESIDNEEA